MTVQLKTTEHTQWQQLQDYALQLQNTKLSELMRDPKRAQQYSIEVDGLFLDYSKNYIDETVMDLLLDLAQSHSLEESISALFSGKKINKTENRAALHTALRSDLKTPILVANQDMTPLIKTQKEKMYQMVQKLNTQQWLGATLKPITDVVNIGIGGSDLGPLMALEALKPYHCSALNIHFASNIDPEVMESLFHRLNPETTLFIISSKSFSTPETLTNAYYAKTWLTERLKTQQLEQHFIAITANPSKAQAFGIPAHSILDFWDWVGGRFSIWSSIGFVLALSIGQAQFEAFLAGGRSMDHHFANSPFEKNMPVMMALLGLWYHNFWNAASIAILPYSEALRSFPAYLQQLDMESNGKSVQLNGEKVTYSTGPIVWGQAGTNGQHAFYQLLHQGTHCIPIDFILFAQTRAINKVQHWHLVANGLAQSAALLSGCTQVEESYQYMSGNKPSNTLLFKVLSPFALGQLIALYEHKVFVQGILWNINSFDQPGVELGKKMANQMIASLHQEMKQWDPSSAQLLEKVKTYSEGCID